MLLYTNTEHTVFEFKVIKAATDSNVIATYLSCKCNTQHGPMQGQASFKKCVIIIIN